MRFPLSSELRGLAAACLIAGVAFGAALPGAHAQTAAAPTPAGPVRNVVLVHGAWADGSSWNKVIPILQAAGLHVTAVQNPLTSLADAAAVTRRVLAQQDGPTVLVGHSWSGTLVSEVGNDPKVAALVYVAARAPDAGEDFVALSKQFPTMPVRAGVQVYDGFTTLSEDAYVKYFANGLPEQEAKVLFAEQQPTAASLFADRTTAAAWHDKPSWAVIATDDRAFDQAMLQHMAERAGATITNVPASHALFLTQAGVVAVVIETAAQNAAGAP